MTKRALLALSLPLLFVASGCDPIRVADIVLLVRESPQNPRTQNEPVTISWVLDGEPQPNTQTFDNGFFGPGNGIPIGTKDRTIDMTVFTGAAATPTSLGRVDRFTLVGTENERPEAAVVVEKALFVGAPGVAELVVDDNLPQALDAAAACFDATGSVFLAGGVTFDGGRSSLVYVLDTLRTLRMDSTGNLPVQNLPNGTLGDVACGAFGGQWFVYLGECIDDVPGGTGRLVRGTGTTPDQEITAGGSGCRPRVVVGEQRAWITMSDRIVVYGKDDFADPTQIFSADIVIDRARYDIALDGDALIIAGGRPGLTIARLAPGSDPPIDVAEADGQLDAVALVELGDTVFALDVAGDLHDLGVPTGERVPRAAALDDIDAATITDALFLADGRLVALAADAVVVEGSASAPNPRRRQYLARTIGDAVVLLGGEPGFDVLIAP